MSSLLKVVWGFGALFALPTAALALALTNPLGVSAAIAVSAITGAIYLWSILPLSVLLPSRPPRPLQGVAAAMFAIAMLD